MTVTTHLERISTEPIKISSLSVSKNGKNLLVCCNTLNRSYVALTDQHLNIIYKFQCPSTNSASQQVQAVFNSALKKLGICWTYGSISRMQTFSLGNPDQVVS